jgi:hypothetical protein
MDLKRIETGGFELDSSGSGEGLLEGCCDHSDEPLGSLKIGDISWIAKRLLASK